MPVGAYGDDMQLLILLSGRLLPAALGSLRGVRGVVAFRAPVGSDQGELLSQANTHQGGVRATKVVSAI